MPEGLQIIKVILPTDVKNVEIVPIGDGHLGEAECDISLLRDVVEYVRCKSLPVLYYNQKGERPMFAYIRWI